MDNTQLYETAEVIGKYSRNTTRVNSLNNPEKLIIDKFLARPQKILDVGCGAGRVAANLYLYGHKVKGIDLSVGMIEVARKKFPRNRFQELVFEHDDAITLSKQEGLSYDVVFFTMNTIDYLKTVDDRKSAIRSSYRVLKEDGFLMFSSHNHKAYLFSYKDMKTNSFSERVKYLLRGKYFSDTILEEEDVIGGGKIWKSKPEYMVDFTESLGFKFVDFAVDARSRLDTRISRSFTLSTYVFDYFLYVFKKI